MVVATTRWKLIRLSVFVALLSLAAWGWALASFSGKPALLGVSLVIYGLGLRHGLDADHVAAIDNVTRKLMNCGQRPLAVGLFFALGHSSVVVLVTAVLAGYASAASAIANMREAGGMISTLVSVTFLFGVAAINVSILKPIYADFRALRKGGSVGTQTLSEEQLSGRGPLSLLLRPLFRVVSQSWHMFPLGLLFGLGFDTATEVAMFGISASQAAHGVPLISLLIFPALFAAGMSLIDTVDGVLMVGAYDWAFISPVRKLYYNLTITLISIAVAVLIGSIELISMMGRKLLLDGQLWKAAAHIADNMNLLGLVVIVLFFGCWLISFMIYHLLCIGKCSTSLLGRKAGHN